MPNDTPFQFEISLSVLNHLGRNLYRNFITVLGEAISNAWDADADNVWIYIERDNNNFVIKDDGEGMDSTSFQNKFLKVGYSKRRDGNMVTPRNRPFIGAKGIGKLALLSCAQNISIISKTTTTDYVGGIIDNSELDDAIQHDMTPDQYPLGEVNVEVLREYTANHEKGTIIYFKDTKENIRNTIPYLKKIIALNFRFSLIDNTFNIYVNNELVNLDDLIDLSNATEFLWNINSLNDPYFRTLRKLKNEVVDITEQLNLTGFIASVIKPRSLKIAGTEEKVGIDLFVNGRLREKNILKHMPDFSTRYVASYLYGQIHFDELDGDTKDRFTTSRESIRSGDSKFESLIKVLKEKILPQISDEWDSFRLSRGEDGDDENKRKSKKARRARSLLHLSSSDYTDTESIEIDNWVKELQPDAEYNIPAYVDCFISENLARKLIEKNDLPIVSQRSVYEKWRRIESEGKVNGNLSIDIRRNNSDLFYLSMEPLVKIIESPSDGRRNDLLADEKQYTPIRNGVMHTALLTEEAKRRLTTVYDNIKGRLRILLLRD